MIFRWQRPLRKYLSKLSLVAAVFILWLSIHLDWPGYLFQRWHPSVNLVIALTSNQDSSWTSKIVHRNLKVIPYIADDPTAAFHPPANKGREAIMYLAYILQFYDSLPEVTIFVHGDDVTWHIDSIFERSTANAINQLHLGEVMRRKYLNLRIDWKNACPAWMNTTSNFNGSTMDAFYREDTHNGSQGDNFEQPYMKAAFMENFPDTPVPEILAQPCCSQFAVTREAIRSVPKERYQKQLEWLLDTPLSDQITGRLWEHMWQYQFLQKAVDCPAEHKALCRGWHICFESQHELEVWNAVARKREILQPSLGRADPPKGVLENLDELLRKLKEPAIRRGRSKSERDRIAGEM